MTDSVIPPHDIDVLVVDPVRLHRENLVAALHRQAPIADVSGAADCEDALRSLRDRPFSVVLLSTRSSSVRASYRELVAAAAPAAVIAYGVATDGDEVLVCAEAGVAGYLLQEEPLSELVHAVATAAQGEVRCPPRVAAVLMRRMGPRGAMENISAGAGRLTSREQEILALIDDGMSNKEIARRLTIEVRTVKNHVHNLLEKLQVHRRGEAAALVRSRVGTRTTAGDRLVPRDQVSPGPLLNTKLHS
jgi:two-component system, NarL family, nitrate/nitrite response regulator NarL